MTVQWAFCVHSVHLFSFTEHWRLSAAYHENKEKWEDCRAFVKELSRQVASQSVNSFHWNLNKLFRNLFSNFKHFLAYPQIMPYIFLKIELYLHSAESHKWLNWNLILLEFWRKIVFPRSPDVNNPTFAVLYDARNHSGQLRILPITVIMSKFAFVIVIAKAASSYMKRVYIQCLVCSLRTQ